MCADQAWPIGCQLLTSDSDFNFFMTKKEAEVKVAKSLSKASQDSGQQ